jgi:hypothetical protein
MNFGVITNIVGLVAALLAIGGTLLNLARYRRNALSVWPSRSSTYKPATGVYQSQDVRVTGLGHTLLRMTAFALGAIGGILLLIVNALGVLGHSLSASTGHISLGSPGIFGLCTFVIAAAGAISALFAPAWGALLMFLGGTGFFYAAGSEASIPAPLLFLAALLAYMSRPH